MANENTNGENFGGMAPGASNDRAVRDESKAVVTEDQAVDTSAETDDAEADDAAPVDVTAKTDRARKSAAKAKTGKKR